MTLLILNSGSSTLKFDLAQVGARGNFQRLARGVIERIGANAEFSARVGEGSVSRQRVSAANHHDAVWFALDWLKRDAPAQIHAVGHRVVHGGERFIAPTLIDEAVLSALDELSELAPLHNPAALQSIRAAREIVGRELPMVAVFDTAFFSDLPPRAATYALPREITERHRIRRYGFHGIAHEFMLVRYTELQRVPIERATLITLQLGNGCSVAAIKDGRAVDVSMGFTPLEGLVMGTRSGDLDPSLVGYLARAGKLSIGEVEQLLNEKSGLLGLSGISSDMRDLLAVENTDARAALAIEMFCYRARKYIGAYLAALGGAQAVIFGGGIGENCPTIRARICNGMEWCGLQLDVHRNDFTLGKENRITAATSSLHSWVIAVDESQIIAQQTAKICSTFR